MDDALDLADRRLGQVEVDDQQVLDELRATGQHRAVRRDDQRVAVEHQLVLAAHQVEVGEGAAGLGRAPAGQLEPGVVLLPLVRRAVDDQQQLGTGLAGLGDRAALLPEVLADGECDVHAAYPYDGQVVPGDEDAELVEHAVVGQVVLGVAGHHLAAMQHGNAVLRHALGDTGATVLADAVTVPVGVAPARAVEIADDHRQVAETVIGQSRCERGDCVKGCVDERAPQSEVFNGVAGQHHLGERDQVGSLGRGARRPFTHGARVVGQVTDDGVHLGQGEAQLRHGSEPRGAARR